MSPRCLPAVSPSENPRTCVSLAVAMWIIWVLAISSQACRMPGGGGRRVPSTRYPRLFCWNTVADPAPDPAPPWNRACRTTWRLEVAPATSAGRIDGPLPRDEKLAAEPQHCTRGGPAGSNTAQPALPAQRSQCGAHPQDDAAPPRRSVLFVLAATAHLTSHS